MPNKNDIPGHDPIDEDELAGRGMDRKSLRQTVLDNMSEIPKRKFWKQTRTGRFLSLRTKTSKTVVGVLAAAGTTLLPPPVGNIVNGTINLLIPNPSTMDVLTDMSLLQIIITIAAFLVVTGVPMLFKGVRDSVIWKAVKGRIDAIADEVVQAVDAESEGGKKITRSEVQDIIRRAVKPKDEDV